MAASCRVPSTAAIWRRNSPCPPSPYRALPANAIDGPASGIRRARFQPIEMALDGEECDDQHQRETECRGNRRAFDAALRDQHEIGGDIDRQPERPRHET